MRTEDDKKEAPDSGAPNPSDKDRSDSPGEMVIDEEKHDDFPPSTPAQGAPPPSSGPSGYSYSYMKEGPGETPRLEPKPLLSEKYEPLSDED